MNSPPPKIVHFICSVFTSMEHSGTVLCWHVVPLCTWCRRFIVQQSGVYIKHFHTSIQFLQRFPSLSH